MKSRRPSLSLTFTFRMGCRWKGLSFFFFSFHRHTRMRVLKTGVAHGSGDCSQRQHITHDKPGTRLPHHNFGATANEEDGVTTVRTVMTINHPEKDPAGSQLSLFPPKRRAGWLTMIHVAFLSSQLPARESTRKREKKLRGGDKTLLSGRRGPSWVCRQRRWGPSWTWGASFPRRRPAGGR